MRIFHLLLAALVFICGIVSASLGTFAFFPAAFLPAINLILFASLIFLRKDDVLFAVLFVFFVFFLGAFRYIAFNRADNLNVGHYHGPVLVQGKVASDPEESPRGKKRTFILEAAFVKGEGEEKFRRASGLALVTAYNREAFDYKYGDIVVLEGDLKEPPSYYTGRRNFDYRKYLAHKRIYCVLNVKKGSFSKVLCEDKNIFAQFARGMYSIRKKIEIHIKNYLNAPEDSVLMAVLLGKRRGIPKDLADSFARTGTIHILAISGLHVGIIYFMLKIILKLLRMPHNVSIAVTVVLLLCFTVMAGSHPSILRATAMFSILGGTEVLKRKINIFSSIGLSGLILLLFNPNQIFDIGFVLSYMAVLSIVGISPLFSPALNRSAKPGKTGNIRERLKYLVLGSVSISLAVYLGVFPLTAYYFGLFSPIVVIANLVVVPLVTAAMGAGLLFIITGFLWKPLACVFSRSAWFFLSAMVNSVRLLEKIPCAYFYIKPPSYAAIFIYYCLLISAVIFFTHVRNAKN